MKTVNKKNPKKPVSNMGRVIRVRNSGDCSCYPCRVIEYTCGICRNCNQTARHQKCVGIVCMDLHKNRNHIAGLSQREIHKARGKIAKQIRDKLKKLGGLLTEHTLNSGYEDLGEEHPDEEEMDEEDQEEDLDEEDREEDLDEEDREEDLEEEDLDEEYPDEEDLEDLDDGAEILGDMERGEALAEIVFGDTPLDKYFGEAGEKHKVGTVATHQEILEEETLDSDHAVLEETTPEAIANEEIRRLPKEPEIIEIYEDDEEVEIIENQGEIDEHEDDQPVEDMGEEHKKDPRVCSDETLGDIPQENTVETEEDPEVNQEVKESVEAAEEDLEDKVEDHSEQVKAAGQLRTEDWENLIKESGQMIGNMELHEISSYPLTYITLFREDKTSIKINIKEIIEARQRIREPEKHENLEEGSLKASENVDEVQKDPWDLSIRIREHEEGQEV